jgi:hypothetical protein
MMCNSCGKVEIALMKVFCPACEIQMGGSLRGFGTTFELRSGTSRGWYVGRDGVRRFVDNGQIVPAAAPGSPEGM